MLYRIIGRAGSGKTEYLKTLIAEKSGENKPCVVVVPAQQSMEYEKDIFTRLGGHANLNVEVLTFDRLPNRTYREYGGLAAKYCDEGGRSLLMARALEKARSRLSTLSKIKGNAAFVEKLSRASAALKENGVDHKTLAGLEGDSPPRAKARDLHIILSEFDSLFTGSVTDGKGALDIYAENLKSMGFFEGKSVFFDSFYSFTPQQLKVIGRIADRCEDIYITFCLDTDDKSGVFDSPRLSFDHISRSRPHKDIVLTENKRARNEELKYAEQNLWDASSTPFPQSGEKCGASAVEFIKCADKFSQAESAASVVSRLVREGYRYKDIVVLVRQASDFSGVIDVVLEKHGIPCFFAPKESVLLKPLAVFLLSAVECVTSGYPVRAVKRFIKSGFVPITRRQSNLITRYISSWGIKGRVWVSEKEFLANPSGFKEQMSPAEESELKEINAAKEVTSELFRVLEESLFNEDKTVTGSTLARSLYALLECVSARETLSAKAKKLAESGFENESRKLSTLWDIIITSLEQIDMSCGDEILPPPSVLPRLEIALSSYGLGGVPASCDSVIIGDASIFRGDNPRAAILLGVDDGLFPASPGDDGLFGNRELLSLEKSGIYLWENLSTRLDNERLYFYTAVAAPSEKLFCVYSDSPSGGRPSIGALRLMALFPGAEYTHHGEKPRDRVFSPASAVENSPFASPGAREFLLSRGSCNLSLAELHPLSEQTARISGNSPSFIRLSPTALEKYAGCMFSYFGKYLLKLSDNKKHSFSYSEIGTFVHKTLEVFVSERMGTGSFEKADDSFIENWVDDFTSAYINKICGGEAAGAERFAYMTNRLKTTLKLLLKNISDELSCSSFVPEMLEYSFRESPAEYIVNKDVKASLGGVIDRVDIYKDKASGDTYVRVVDYKTGNKSFSQSRIEKGLDMQLLLYLFAICEKISGNPASAVYLSSKLETVAVSPDMNDKAKEKKLNSAFKRSGIVLDETALINALDPSMDKRFSPFTAKGDGKPSASKSRVSREEIEELKETTHGLLKTFAGLISDGVMDVSPLKSGSSVNACEHCELKPVCRLSREKSVERSSPPERRPSENE